MQTAIDKMRTCVKIAHFLSVAVFRIFLYRVRCIEKSYIYNKVKKYIFLFFFYSSNSIRLYNDICLAFFYFLSFSRSRISANNFSSLEGSGAGAGFCSASTLFLRAKRFMPLTSMKTQKAIMMKSKSVWMKLP